MSTVKDLETLLSFGSGTEHLSRRKPNFWNLYEGGSDKFDFDLKTLGETEKVLRFVFEHYFRIQVRGVQNIPAEGGVILAGNHSGTLPIDALMTFQASLEHESPRRLRYLVLPWFKRIGPVWHLLSRLGSVEANFQNALTLLDDGEIVGIYPEAERAMTKNWTQRYQLRHFDPGFVKLAIATQTPIVPVITIGAEESYPNFGNWDAMARFTDMPIFPVTLTFPWLPFPFMFAPVPARWHIRFGKPIKLNYPKDKSFDTELVNRIAEDIRRQLQEELNCLLAKRRSILSGWDDSDLDQEALQAASNQAQMQ
jgi:1-acyl-sn-glycerol-3-phosphate acyltransferase